MSQSIPRTAVVFAILLLISNLAISGPLEDGFVAYKQGDVDLAHQKWLLLAIKGDPRAQFFLSVLLENRKGGLEDSDNAKKWLTASANNGFVPARFNLGNNFYQGKYGEVNNKMAEYWWSQAAVQGFAEAQYHLATLYYWGKRGVKLNLKESFYWFEQAEKSGYKDAIDAVLLLRAGEPLQPPKANEPANIAYDDPRIVSKLALASKQMAAVKPQKKQIATAPVQVEKPKHESRLEHADNDWVLQQPGSNYTIQLFASTSLLECKSHIEQLLQNYQLQGYIQPFMKNNRKYCAVISGSYESYAQAKTGLSQLPHKIKQSKPWLRKMAR